MLADIDGDGHAEMLIVWPSMSFQMCPDAPPLTRKLYFWPCGVQTHPLPAILAPGARCELSELGENERKIVYGPQGACTTPEPAQIGTSLTRPPTV